MKKIIILVVLLWVSISGCTQFQNMNKPTPSVIPVQTIEIASTSTSIPPTNTALPPTATSTPVPPTPTLIPTIHYPVNLGTAFPESGQPITMSNLDQIKEVAEYWGNPISAEFFTKDKSRAYLFTVEGCWIYDTESNSLIRNLPFHPYFPHRSSGEMSSWITVSDDGSLIAMLDESQSIIIINDQGEILDKLEKPHGEPSDLVLQFSPDGSYLAIDSRVREIYLQIYDVNKKELVNIPQFDPWNIAFSSNSQFLALMDTGVNVTVLQAPEWKLLQKIATKSHEPLFGFVLIPGTDRIGLFTETEIVVMDYVTKAEISRLSASVGDGSNLSVSPDGNQFIVHYWGGNNKYYDTSTGAEGPSGSVSSSNEKLPPGIDPSLWGPYMDVSMKNAGQFTFRQANGHEIILEAGQQSCTIPISGKPECHSVDGKVITSGDGEYLAAINVTKTTKNGRVLEVQTDISRLDAPGTILGSLPEAGDVNALCAEQSVAFYTPIDMSGYLGPITRGQLSIYDYKNNKQMLSFDTKEKEYIFGFCPPNSPYAVTILNNAVNREDQFNIQFLDGSTETYANNFYKTKNNAQPVVGIDPGGKFFGIASNLPPTEIDYLKVDHIVLNLVYFSHPKDQVVFELPPLSRMDIPEFQADRHSSVYEAVVNDLEISPDGKLAAIATFTGKVVFVDLVTGDIVGEISDKCCICGRTYLFCGLVLYGNI